MGLRSSECAKHCLPLEFSVSEKYRFQVAPNERLDRRYINDLLTSIAKVATNGNWKPGESSSWSELRELRLRQKSKLAFAVSPLLSRWITNHLLRVSWVGSICSAPATVETE